MEEKQTQLWLWLVEDGRPDQWGFPVSDPKLLREALGVVRANPKEMKAVLFQGEQKKLPPALLSTGKPTGWSATLLCPHAIDSNWRAFDVPDPKIVFALEDVVRAQEWPLAFCGRLIGDAIPVTVSEIEAVLDHAASVMPNDSPVKGSPEASGTSSHLQSESETAGG